MANLKGSKRRNRPNAIPSSAASQRVEARLRAARANTAKHVVGSFSHIAKEFANVARHATKK
jgi:hypothetical protein